jgi:hypothetical protein
VLVVNAKAPAPDLLALNTPDKSSKQLKLLCFLASLQPLSSSLLQLYLCRTITRGNYWVFVVSHWTKIVEAILIGERGTMLKRIQFVSAVLF